jgi:hypothetical protein
VRTSPLGLASQRAARPSPRLAPCLATQTTAMEQARESARSPTRSPLAQTFPRRSDRFGPATGCSSSARANRKPLSCSRDNLEILGPTYVRSHELLGETTRRFSDNRTSSPTWGDLHAYSWVRDMIRSSGHALFGICQEDAHLAFNRDNRFGRAHTDYDLRSFGVHRWEYPRACAGYPRAWFMILVGVILAQSWLDRDDRSIMLGFLLSWGRSISPLGAGAIDLSRHQFGRLRL